jgi:hypothetical protein
VLFTFIKIVPFINLLFTKLMKFFPLVHSCHITYPKEIYIYIFSKNKVTLYNLPLLSKRKIIKKEKTRIFSKNKVTLYNLPLLSKRKKKKKMRIFI